MSIYKNTTLEAMNLKLGQNGFDTLAKIEGGEFHQGKWCAIHNPDTDAMIVTAKKGGDILVGNLSLCSNGTLYGDFDYVKTTTSGAKFIVYRIPA